MYLPDSLDHPPLNVRRRASFRESGNSAGAIKSFSPRQEFSTLPRRPTAKEKALWLPKHGGPRCHACSWNFADLQPPSARSRRGWIWRSRWVRRLSRWRRFPRRFREGSAAEALGAASDVLGAAENLGVA